MSTNIKLKKSSVAGRVPLNTDLEYGEVAINYADGRLYYKTSGNTVQHFQSNDSAHFNTLTTDNLTVGNYSFPTADGTANQVLITDGSGTLTFVNRGSVGLDSAAINSIIDSHVDQSFVNLLDANAGTLDGQDGTYYLNYNNFTNTPIIPDSAFVSGIAANTVGPVDSNEISGIVDSAFVQNLIKEDYVATIVDSAYVAIRSGDFVNNFGTVAVVGDLSIDATTGGDTVTFAGGTGIDITTDVNNKRVTIASTANQVFDFGTILSPVGFTLDMGAI
jgi:hypothetical protein